MSRLLLIEDDPTFVVTLEGYLKKLNYEVTSCFRVKTGREWLGKAPFDLILLDYRLPDGTGTDILEFIKQAGIKVPVIIMTSFSDIQTAVRVMKLGALDYITKPVIPEELKMRIEEILKAEADKVDSSLDRKSISDNYLDDYISGSGEISEELQKMINLVAPSDLSTIILGESGTGKEFVARSIHSNSKRSEKPFVAVDCGALTDELAFSELFGHVKGSFTGAIADKKGRFVEADGGTLFLDEVGNLAYEIQVKLLRALQGQEIHPLGSSSSQHVNVRIITATNEKLSAKVEKGEFREDLFHRLNEFKIEVPPLRERQTNLFEFADFFRKQADKDLDRETTGFSDEVRQIFLQYQWPGNIRELRNVVRRAVLLTKENDVIEKESLPQEMYQNSIKTQQPANEFDLKARQANEEKEIIIRTLEKVKFNKSKAARLLNIDRKTLYIKIEKYEINI